MIDSIVKKAAAQFGSGEPVVSLFGDGLIHYSYKVTFPDGNTVLLQCLNQATFRLPENIINNYIIISRHLASTGGIKVPRMCSTRKGKYFWIDETGNFWRATEFMKDSYSLAIASTSEEVYKASACFGEFVKSLAGINPDQLDTIIPGFHNLRLRYDQFEKAIAGGGINRLLKATHVIASLRERYALVEYYDRIAANDQQYPVRIMHHDCKISNILFHSQTKEVICPVDLDTLMPGKFFSDPGDLVRTMACSRDENSTEWEHIDIVPSFYQAIIRGYLDGTNGMLTSAEIQDIHYPGQLLIYMQALRFVTDFLNNDIYYKTTYAEQNLNRALNQLILLEKLETYLSENLPPLPCTQ
jgi:Phosphotransferase enzyme family